MMVHAGENIALPAPATAGQVSVEQVIAQRRSVRDFANTSLKLSDISQLLWSAQGITDIRGLRAAPSAGALYPLEIYVVAGTVDGLAQGVYHYDPQRHQLTKEDGADVRAALTAAALSQAWIQDAAAVIVFTADYQRTRKKYGNRAERYVHIEVGHAAENLFLQAVSLGLASVVVGAFDDDELARVMQLPVELRPLLLMPVGRN
ncbi:MAG: SagB/ThcOx family dehydrogenase [Gammaproteobacteria bacterium]|nr:SagB/ThcOx family dehydrogenase [Gammaproteobacteria bacterium]